MQEPLTIAHALITVAYFIGIFPSLTLFYVPAFAFAAAPAFERLFLLIILGGFLNPPSFAPP